MDHYEQLGVSRDATPEDLKKAYRRLARQLHPDANPEDPDAEARFKEVTRAYEVLSDRERRAHYDRYGTDKPGVAGAGGDPFGFGSINDLFDAFLGGSPFGGAGRGGGRAEQRGSDLEITVTLEFEEAVFGTESDVAVRTAVMCGTCDGSGSAAGSEPQRCSRCDGAGQVRTVRQSILGQMVSTSPCPQCRGAGELIIDPCETCRGDGRVVEDQTLQVRVPAGVDDGATLRLSGRGAVGSRGGRPGDLYVRLRVRPHHRFVRRGSDLHEELGVALTQAALGASLRYETLDGEEVLEVAPGAQSGDIVRLRGLGVPRLEGRGRGDLLVTLRVDTPVDLDQQQAELLRQLAELRGEEIDEPEGGLFSRIRSAFR
jgi:molecular chaperone DnaJ